MKRPSWAALAVLAAELVLIVQIACQHNTLPTALMLWATVAALAAVELRVTHPERSRAPR